MANEFEAKDEQFREKVQQSFAAQKVMQTINATLENVEPGEVEIRMPFDDRLTQQHGFLHAGIVSTALDSACGYAAFSLMPPDAGVLSIEFKVNLLSPAKGDEFVFVAKVLKAGRTITVCLGEAFALVEGKRKLIAQMTATMMTIVGREGMDR